MNEELRCIGRTEKKRERERGKKRKRSYDLRDAKRAKEQKGQGKKRDRTRERINEKILLGKQTRRKTEKKIATRQIHDDGVSLWVSKGMVVKVGKS